MTDFDIHLFKEGKHFHLYEKMGSHTGEKDGVNGTFFSVWAPSAKAVHLIAEFNGWSRDSHPMSPRWDQSGIWEAFVPDVGVGQMYKYLITNQNGARVEKGDPFARHWEEPPRTASIVWDKSYKWGDKGWMKSRSEKAGQPQPYSVYEVHMGSWKKRWEEDNRNLTYGELANELVEYVQYMGFTHVEFMPVMEHPYEPSWGYQIHGYFAPTCRFGSPEDFKYLVDRLHQAGIGIILDWVPSHFPGDEHGLYMFDGTHLFEHADPRKGFHPDWKSYIFNYGRNEVRSFLISNALFWLGQYHIDGLRVDAVASMLYLDYSRKEGEWIPNEYGGNENLEAITFLKQFNEAAYGEFPDIVTIAEESTAWPMVSEPTYLGGLGFGQKWMMGWMHDTLEYFKKEPIHRRYHQHEITFSIMYAFTEKFMLPLSHDEVVHGKGSLISRMPGDEWQRFANLRLMFGYMYMHPGTKLLFMGGEFGQTSEWNFQTGLDWHLVDHEVHKGIQKWVKSLNEFYKDHSQLFDYAFSNQGFRWIDYSDHENSVMAFERVGFDEESPLLIICNFTPQVLPTYRVGVSLEGEWNELLNSDASEYGGSGQINSKSIKAQAEPFHGRDYSIDLTLPPLGIAVLGRK